MSRVWIFLIMTVGLFAVHAKPLEGEIWGATPELFMEQLENDWENLYQKLIKREDYRPYEADKYLGEAQKLFQQGQKVDDSWKKAYPSGALSPMYYMVSMEWVHQKGGSAEAVSVQQKLMEKSLEKLMESGDGSREHPYKVLLVSDEYMILERLGKVVKKSYLIDQDGLKIDMIETQSGEIYLFDITPLYGR